jgi:hypothetical protein
MRLSLRFHALITDSTVDILFLQTVKFGRLRLVTFDGNSLKDELECVRQRAYLRGGNSDNATPKMHVTGVGCTVHGKLISEVYNVR